MSAAEDAQQEAVGTDLNELSVIEVRELACRLLGLDVPPYDDQSLVRLLCEALRDERARRTLGGTPPPSGKAGDWRAGLLPPRSGVTVS